MPRRCHWIEGSIPWNNSGQVQATDVILCYSSSDGGRER